MCFFNRFFFFIFFQIFYFVDLCFLLYIFFSYLASLHSKPLTCTNHGAQRKGFFQSTFDIGETLRVLWEWKGKSGSPQKAIHALLVGNRQAKVIASEWMRPHLRGVSLDTIPPNGIKVAQCTPLLHQRDLPSLVKLGAWKHSPFEDLLIWHVFHWWVKCPVFLTMILNCRETACCLSQRHTSDLFLSGKKRVVWWFLRLANKKTIL